MKRLEYIMGMPVIVEISDNASSKIFDKVFDYFREIDERFSPYKQNSEVTRINNEKLIINNCSKEMQEVLRLCEKTKQETDGYFDAWHDGGFDPSGIVKGWAIYHSSQILKKLGCKNYYINAGADIQTSGLNSKKEKWAVGIRNPFKTNENVKVIYLSGEGVATSGTYERGNHIYTPGGTGNPNIVSLTVIGSNIYEADRFATAAFAMGKKGIEFIEKLKDFEGYMIDEQGTATMTTGFEKYAKN